MTMRVNYYVDIDINGCRALYSESIADRGIARLLNWLDTAVQLIALIDKMLDCYIRVYRSASILLVKYSWAHPWLRP